LGEKVTRAEAMILLGHGPHNRASISQYIRTGQLTVYPGEKRNPHQRGRRKVQYFDTDELDAIKKRQAEAKAEGATATGRLLGPGRQGWAGSVPNPEQQEEQKAKREAFLRETVTEAQARAMLGATHWALSKLVIDGQIRTRRGLGEERYERADVLAEQARRDRQGSKS
jgi:ribonuclease HI